MRMTPRVNVMKPIRRWSISSSARCCDRHALLMISWFTTLSQNNVSDNGSDWCSDTTRRRDLRNIVDLPCQPGFNNSLDGGIYIHGGHYADDMAVN